MGSHSVMERVVIGRRKRYRWDEVVLFVLLFIFLVCAAATLGMISYITYYQNRQFVMIPWYFYFIIITCVLTIIFVFTVWVLYAIQCLLPILVMLFSFILFVLWITGLVKQSIELWGPQGSINDYCVRFVYNDAIWAPPGQNRDTWARIQQEGVCNLWKTTFALELIATFLFLYMIFMSWQVIRSARYG